jgi:AmmeMemoRadiSam system protein B
MSLGRRGPAVRGALPGTRRTPAVAGSFYPADPARLEGDVAALLAAGRRIAAERPPERRPSDEAPGSRVAGRTVGAIVPHAGLMFSGGVAAAAWAALGPDVETVLIAGTNHFAWFEGVGVWPGGAWETPLGDVEVDAAWRDALISLGQPFVAAGEPHEAEHSIEVQLPLLVRALPRARIVPFAVSLASGPSGIAAGRRLGELLREALGRGERVALVASSDLAHYPTDAVAREVDGRVLEPILALDAGAAWERESEIRDLNLPGVACGMCGVDPVVLTLAALREAGAGPGQLLAHATSADVPAGDRRRVVGYAAVVFSA